MNRRKALVAAGFLTAVLATFVVTMGNFASGAPAQNTTAPVNLPANPPIANASADSAATTYLLEVESALAARERALANQLATGKQAITDLDIRAQEQLAAMQGQVTGVEAAVANQSAAVQSLQARIGQLQNAITNDGAAIQQEMAALQAGDAQLMLQLNDTLAQLQSAYDEIAARQGAEAGMNSNNNGGGSNGEEDDDHGDHEDHEEQEDHDEGNDGDDDDD